MVQKIYNETIMLLWQSGQLCCTFLLMLREQ